MFPIVKQVASVALTALVFTTVGALTKKGIEYIEESLNPTKKDDDKSSDVETVEPLC